MSKIITTELYYFNDKLWRVNPSKSGLRTDILRCLLGMLDSALAKHRKVFIFRFDLSVNEYTRNNELIAKLVRRLSRRVKAHYKADLSYCWVRELERAKKQHYHFCVVIDGSKVNHPHMLQEWLILIWEQFGRCSWAGYHNVERGDSLALQDATYHISYLAKPRGKGYRATQTKDYGHSKIR
ncbi:inovirus-type Gp2 protein [Vibrio parahaemolyticus]|nr:inovirus-type Gp2 protein [Vibrio parahaemolyticus]